MPDHLPRSLSRDKIVAVGLDMVNQRGADALTMRGLAQALGVTPMAIYNHFDDKRDLLRTIADHVITSVDFDGGHSDWQRQLRHCFTALRDTCLRNPALPRLLEIEGAAPASALAPMRVAVAALDRAGLSETDSLRTFFLLVGFTLSQAAYQLRGPFPDLDPTRGPQAITLSAEWDFDAGFDHGITLITEGVIAMVKREKD
ncbi:TetR/AcrR family transcriptional regulator [Mycolicibacterium sp. HK-90]|uniref:TetR/AcrR family transcriptional regulator n=1 Tax=Mycolicibacterium sp. HK-90 TaxID=3056937 RepID=UPI00265886B2|nr:TetR/AcrR family transcriptional regulator [Mycolicibacterium sp. HK-90]WKG03519.1 TetR/AcrR family transcriptional regulator [Mycolicibacterium sp. HK-90]